MQTLQENILTALAERLKVNLTKAKGYPITLGSAVEIGNIADLNPADCPHVTIYVISDVDVSDTYASQRRKLTVSLSIYDLKPDSNPHLHGFLLAGAMATAVVRANNSASYTATANRRITPIVYDIRIGEIRASVGSGNSKDYTGATLQVEIFYNIPESNFFTIA